MKILLTLIFLLNAHAEMNHTKREDIDKLYEKMEKAEEDETNYELILNYHLSFVDISHFESSSAANFFPINEEKSLKIHNLGFRLGREFFKKSSFSFTPYFMIAKSYANNEDTFAFQSGVDGNGKAIMESLEYKDKAESELYGAGISFNYNFSYKNQSLQAFFAYFITREKRKYQSIYRHEDGGSASINLVSDIDYSTSMISSGVRWINEEIGVFSEFALNFQSITIDKREDKLLVDRQSSSLTSSTNFDEIPISLNLGMGILF